jgi:AraC-like DNA-binding protein
MPKRLRTEKLENIEQENLRMRRGATVIGDILYSPGGSCGPRYQHDYQLVVIHRGELNLLLDGEHIHVPTGHGILLTPGHSEHFLFSRNQQTHHSWVAIAPRAVPTSLRRAVDFHLGPIPFGGRMMTLLEMSRRAQITRSAEEPVQAAFYLSLGLAILCDFLLAARSGQSTSDEVETILSKMDCFIWKELAHPLSLSDIARAVGISRQHLLKLCRMHRRPTPISQLYQARLQASTDLLRQSGLSISEIAEKCGFVNIFHFSRRFKQTYGQSPSSWRKDLWAGLARFSNAQKVGLL